MPSDLSRRRAGGTPQTPAPRSAGTIPSGASPARSERFRPSLPDPASPGRPSRRLAQPRRPPRPSDKGPGRGQDGGLGCRAPSQPHNRGSARRVKPGRRIVARERLQNERGVAGCSGHGAQVIEGLHVRADADEARPSVCWLEAHNAAEGGGISDGSSRIRTESERAQPRRDGRCGAPARSARDAVELPGIPRGPEMGIDGRWGGCEFVGKRLTEHDGARPAQARDALRVLRRHMVPEEARSVRGTDPRRLDDVLYSVRNAVERPRSTRRPFAGAPPALYYSAAAAILAGRKAGMTSFANRSRSSSWTSRGVPSGVAHTTRSTPG